MCLGVPTVRLLMDVSYTVPVVYTILLMSFMIIL